MERSIAGQVEFWARIGRAIEPLMEGTTTVALCRNASARPLSDCVASVDTARGRRRVRDFLTTQPFPHYEPHPEIAGLLVRIEADGNRTVGRFVNRKFKLVKPRQR